MAEQSYENFPVATFKSGGANGRWADKYSCHDSHLGWMIVSSGS